MRTLFPPAGSAKRLSRRLEEKMVAALSGRARDFTKVDFFRYRLGQLGFLMDVSQKLRPHPLELAEQPFDRLLLSHSRRYVRARWLAKKMGIDFEPCVLSARHAAVQFDPAADRLCFAPVARELGWIVSGSADPSIRGGARTEFENAKRYVTSLYHETNHAILFRLLRPMLSRRARRRDTEGYFSLIEAIAIWLDQELAAELATVSHPLYECGAVYRKYWRSSSGVGAGGLTAFERFSGQIFVAILQLSGRSPRVAFKELSELGLGSRILGGMRTHPEFFRNAHRAWTRHYIKAHGPGLRLPRPLSLPGVSPFHFGCWTFQELLDSPGELERLHSWLNELYRL